MTTSALDPATALGASGHEGRRMTALEVATVVATVLVFIAIVVFIFLCRYKSMRRRERAIARGAAANGAAGSEDAIVLPDAERAEGRDVYKLDDVPLPPSPADPKHARPSAPAENAAERAAPQAAPQPAQAEREPTLWKRVQGLGGRHAVDNQN